MDATAWISLLRRIPENKHDALVLVTGTGAEIMVQKIVKLERDFAILRGRMAGATDAGRVLMMPYDQINNIAFHKPILEAEILAIFGKAVPPVVVPEAPSPAVADVTELPTAVELPEAEPQPVAAEVEPEPAALSASARMAGKPGAVSKSLLLARLRARLNGDAGHAV